MSTSELVMGAIIRASTPFYKGKDLNLNELLERLQVYFPEHNVSELLEKYELIIGGKSVHQLLVYRGLVKIIPRSSRPDCNLIDMFVTEHGVNAIRSFLQYCLSVDREKTEIGD